MKLCTGNVCRDELVHRVKGSHVEFHEGRRRSSWMMVLPNMRASREKNRDMSIDMISPL